MPATSGFKRKLNRLYDNAVILDIQDACKSRSSEVSHSFGFLVSSQKQNQITGSHLGKLWVCLVYVLVSTQFWISGLVHIPANWYKVCAV